MQARRREGLRSFPMTSRQSLRAWASTLLGGERRGDHTGVLRRSGVLGQQNGNSVGKCLADKYYTVRYFEVLKRIMRPVATKHDIPAIRNAGT
jgi:hypothetical protein